MRKILFCILFSVTAVSLPLEGQDVKVTAALDTSRILIGDQISYSVTVEQPSGIKLSIPVLRDTLVKNVEILTGPSTDTSVISGNRIRITDKYLITSFDSGYYMINPVFAELNDNNGIKRYYSDYAILEVTRVKLTPPDTTAKIFDIAGPYKAPLTLGEILPWLLAGLITAAIVMLVIRLIRLNKRTKGELVKPLVIEPAHVIAFRELEKLRGEQLWQKGETKKFYTRLTEIVRQYLENRFYVYSMEMTTPETLQALLKTGFRKDGSYNRLKSVLTEADLVKFAKYKPGPEDNENCFSECWEFVNATKAEATNPENTDPSRDKEGGKGQ